MMSNRPDQRQHRSISTPPVVMDKARFAQTRGNAQLTREFALTGYRKINGQWMKAVLAKDGYGKDCEICGREYDNKSDRDYGVCRVCHF